MLLLIGLTVYCVIDIVRSTPAERLGVHPALWVAFVLLVPLLGVLAWLAVRWSRRAATAGPTGDPRARGRSTGPDDDPDFLRGLDEDRRRTDPGTSGETPPVP